MIRLSNLRSLAQRFGSSFLALTFLLTLATTTVQGSAPVDTGDTSTPTSPDAYIWQLQRVKPQKLFSEMGDHSLRLDTAGKAHLAYGGDHLYYASYLGSGGNCGPSNAWFCETVDPADGVGLYTSLFLDTNNYPHIAYYDALNGDLKYARNLGSGWEIFFIDKPTLANEFLSSEVDFSADEVNADRYTAYREWQSAAAELGQMLDTAALEALVGDLDGRGLYPSIAVRGGDTYIAYYDSINGDLKFARPVFSGWQIQTLDSGDDVGAYTSMALDTASGHVHVSYYDATKGDLKYIYWNGLAWSAPMAVDGGGTGGANAGQYTSIALTSGTTRLPRISYYDATNKNLKYAEKGGSSWEVETVVSAGSVGLHTSLALNAYNTPHISYYDEGNNDLRFARWTTGGWSDQAVITTDFVGRYTSLVLDSGGNALISFYDPSNGQIKFATQTGATSWAISLIDSMADYGAFSSLAFGSDGNPRIAFFEDVGDNLLYARWTGTDWDIQFVDSVGEVGFYASLALGPGDVPHISYYDVGNQRLRYAYWTGSNWQSETVDSGKAGKYSSLALTSTGLPYIAYYDEDVRDLLLAFKTSPSSSWSFMVVDSDDDVGQYASLELDPSNLPHISYYDAHNKWLKYAVWNPSLNKWDTKVADSQNEVGIWTSLDLDSANRPHITYFRDYNDDLLYTRWDGTQWIREVVDSGSAGVGLYSSLVLDSTGTPHVAYYVLSSSKLKYGTRSGAGWVTQTVDSAGDVGRYVSIALSSSGTPAIAYYDATNGDLKYATSIYFVPKAVVYLPMVRK